MILDTEITSIKGVTVVVWGQVKHPNEADPSPNSKPKPNAYVVNADRTKGITIHSLDTDKKVSCINREQLMYHWRNRRDRNRLWHEVFSIFMDMIKEGVVYTYGFSKKGVAYYRNDDPFAFGIVLDCSFL